MTISVLWALALLAGLLLVCELLRRFRWAAFGVFFILPILLVPVWLQSGIGEWFKWAKLGSVIFAGLWVWVVRFTPWGQVTGSRFLILVILGGNILEACVQDIQSGSLWNWLNAVAGLVSILAMRGWKEIGPSGSPAREMLWKGLDLPWILAYTVWNWTFVYFNFPQLTLIHTAVLLTPLVAHLVIPGTWAQARAYSLALWMMLEFTFSTAVSGLPVPIPRPEMAALGLGAASLAANGAVFVHGWYRRRQEAR